MITRLALKQGFNKKIMQPLIHQKLRRRYADHPVSFISSNCAGGVFSHDCEMRFLSPTVNSWMSPGDYIKFIENMDVYLKLPFKDGHKEENYPVGLIGDIKVHCIHYSTFEDAKIKWEVRSKRVDKHRIVLTMTDQNGCSRELAEKFDALPFPKIFLTSNEKYSDLKSAVYMDSNVYKENHKGRTLVDDAFLFVGLSGKRNYEKFIDLQRFFEKNGL